MLGGARRLVGDWWWSLDRPTLFLVISLLGAGLLLSLAASPAAAGRLIIADPFVFFWRQLVFAGLALATCLAISTLSPLGARRLCALILVVGFVLLVVTLAFGVEVKGARRWLRLGGVGFQPSEFVKPALIVTAAWLIGASRGVDGAPGATLSAGLFALTAGLLLAQPDVGQTALLSAAFGVLAVAAGLSWVRVTALVGAALAGLAGAYLMFDHVRARLDQFINPAAHDTYQVDRAHAAIERGGLIGVGPGEGVVKHDLPDPHTDFVFAVGAEEYGLVLVLTLTALYAGLVVRSLMRAERLASEVARLAATGLASLIGLQAGVNVGVNLGLLPAKGMTLPFISYGGSSLVALGLTAGLLLAFTRARPGAFVDVGGSHHAVGAGPTLAPGATSRRRSVPRSKERSS